MCVSTIDRPGAVDQPRLGRAVAHVVSNNTAGPGGTCRPRSSRGSCRRGAGSPARTAAAGLCCMLGIGLALGRDEQLAVGQERQADQVERGVVGQVGRLPDDLAVVGPAAGQLERGEQILVLQVAGQAPRRARPRRRSRTGSGRASRAMFCMRQESRGCGTTPTARASCRSSGPGRRYGRGS